jgi:hypothetical protein
MWEVFDVLKVGLELTLFYNLIGLDLGWTRQGFILLGHSSLQPSRPCYILQQL